MKTESSLIPFTNAEFGKVRAMLIDGEPWFVGKDVATALGYTNSRKALKDHVDTEDKKDGVTIRDSIGREQKPTLINESGLYALIFGSKLESAKQFKRWTTSEVLPTLRKTGTYSIRNEPRWLETRQNTKISHKPFTHAIKLMLDYLNNRGNEYVESYVYGRITNLVQNACGIIKGQRDSSPVASLNKCDQCQSMVANLILNIIAAGRAKSLSDFEANIILQLSNLNNLLCGQPVILLGGGGHEFTPSSKHPYQKSTELEE